MRNIEKSLVEENKERLNRSRAALRLLGRRIVGVRYMTEEERNNGGWGRRSIILTLDDGTIIFPMADDECNDAGVLSGQSWSGEPFLIPVI